MASLLVQKSQANPDCPSFLQPVPSACLTREWRYSVVSVSINGLKQTEEAMIDFNDAAEANTCHPGDSPHGDTRKVVHDGKLGDELVAVETLRQDPRGIDPEALLTALAPDMGHFVEKGFRFRRRSLDHRPVPHLNDCKFVPTDRADRWGLNRDHLIGSGVFPAMARMADPRFPFLLSVFFRGSLFDGEWRRRRTLPSPFAPGSGASFSAVCSLRGVHRYGASFEASLTVRHKSAFL